jgi:hypothetical protein
MEDITPTTSSGGLGGVTNNNMINNLEHTFYFVFLKK